MNTPFNTKFVSGLMVLVALLATVMFSSKLVAEEPAKKESVKKDASKIQETVLGMNVSGNKEAPNLLYIIPWKANTDELPSPQIYRLMDEVYSTVDPDVFQKEVHFFEQLVEPKGAKLVKDDD
jgi:hypothetical protein